MTEAIPTKMQSGYTSVGSPAAFMEAPWPKQSKTFFHCRARSTDADLNRNCKNGN